MADFSSERTMLKWYDKSWFISDSKGIVSDLVSIPIIYPRCFVIDQVLIVYPRQWFLFDFNYFNWYRLIVDEVAHICSLAFRWWKYHNVFHWWRWCCLLCFVQVCMIVFIMYLQVCQGIYVYMSVMLVNWIKGKHFTAFVLL